MRARGVQSANVANGVVHSELNGLSVIQFAAPARQRRDPAALLPRVPEAFPGFVPDPKA